jgi:DNA-binding IscR family transcriptional regulator
VAASHERGGPGVPREQLASDFGLSADVVGRLVRRLKERDLIAEVRGDKDGLIPARAAAAIPVSEILTAFRATDFQIAAGALSPALAKLIGDLEETRRQRIEGLNLAELLPPAETPPAAGEVRAFVARPPRSTG